jgi:hypothetical protein
LQLYYFLLWMSREISSIPLVNCTFALFKVDIALAGHRKSFYL